MPESAGVFRPNGRPKRSRNRSEDPCPHLGSMTGGQIRRRCRRRNSDCSCCRFAGTTHEASDAGVGYRPLAYPECARPIGPAGLAAVENSLFPSRKRCEGFSTSTAKDPSLATKDPCLLGKHDFEDLLFHSNLSTRQWNHAATENGRVVLNTGLLGGAGVGEGRNLIRRLLPYGGGFVPAEDRLAADLGTERERWKR